MSAWSLVVPEQRSIETRDVSSLPKARIPAIPAPDTITKPLPKDADRLISLDEAIQIALANSKVVRVLTGVSATASGRTIYDAAITNTTIDQERGRFDPAVILNNSFDRTELPQALLNFAETSGASISGFQTNGYNLLAGLSKTTTTGGVAKLEFMNNLARFDPGIFPLNPQDRYSTTLRFDQPLLQGAGRAANLSPIVIARINTERSFFQFKDAVQEMVRGVIEAYWALVFARVDVKARQLQIDLSRDALKFEKAQVKAKVENKSRLLQSQSALANFEAALVLAKANVIQREAALRNILGLPPADNRRLVPSTPMTTERMMVDWDNLVGLAEERRPDLIELKLIIEADQQLLIQAENRALPKVDAVALYRWNGLEGTTPSRTHIGTQGDQFGDWTVGVNFSLPLGMRSDRAVLRQQKLILARDWANLDQGLHLAIHDLGSSVRFLSQFYEQYRSLHTARNINYENLSFQRVLLKSGAQSDPAFFLVVVQAITDWGNAASAEAQALAQYNTELANLEKQSGTILETHQIYFLEERFAAIGPLGRCARPRNYPSSLPPTPNSPRYLSMPEPAEVMFDFDDVADLLKSPPKKK